MNLMKLRENVEKSLHLANSNNVVTDTTFKSLLENCFAVLTGNEEPHNIHSLYNSKPDLVKELYAALLSATAEFVRNGQNRDAVIQILNGCSYSATKVNLYGDYYEKYREDIETVLVNINCHLPHITDATWKIDYVIKSSNIDKSDGPLFRIAFQTEKFDATEGAKKIEFIHFTCNSQELQDLVYKLKDAVRHCQKVGSEH